MFINSSLCEMYFGQLACTTVYKPAICPILQSIYIGEEGKVLSNKLNNGGDPESPFGYILWSGRVGALVPSFNLLQRRKSSLQQVEQHGGSKNYFSFGRGGRG